MGALAKHIRRTIAKDGPLTVARYMEEALSNPGLGYYMGRDPLGGAGDFITAPEISQMFGELIGLWCVVLWRAMGRPDPVHLVELGPGRGTLMADMLRAGQGAEGFLDVLSPHLVEISPALKASQEETLAATGAARPVQWWSDFSETPEGPLLLIANEFFDALPVQQFQMTEAGWRERLVGLDGEGEGENEGGGRGGGGFRFVLATDPAPPDALPPGLEGAGEGDIAEARPAAFGIARAIAGRLARTPGAALIIDYGHAVSAPGDTLQAVAGHQYRSPLADPGEADLTAHVDFGELARAAKDAGAQVHGPVGQGAFLDELGIGVRAEALTAATPTAAEDIARERRRLTSAAGMGRLFKVLALTTPGMETPPGFE